MAGRSALSPKQLFAWIIVGHALAWSAFVEVLFTRFLRNRDHLAYLTGIWMALAGLLAGFAIVFWAESLLKRGIASATWPESQLEPLRRWVNLPGLGVALCLPMGVYFILLIKIGSPIFGSLALFLAPFTGLIRLQQYLRPPKPTIPREPVRLKPLVSDHWGNA